MTSVVDIHCHILPGVDDGARTAEESARMLAAARAAGIRFVYATPHLYSVNDDIDEIRRRYEELSRDAARQGILLRLGFEVNFRALPDMADLKAFCLADTDALLIEMDNRAPFPGYLSYIADMRATVRPIIAHPERYVYVQNQPAIADALVRAGCEIQVSADAFALPILHPARRTAMELLRRGVVHYIASDAHTQGDYAAFTRAGRYVDRLATSEAVRIGR